MPITIKGVTSARVGLVAVAMSDFASDLDGTHVAPADNAGALNPSLSAFSASLRGQFAVPDTFDGLIDATLDAFTARFQSESSQDQQLLITLPNWNDEHAAYLSRGLTIDAGNDEHIEGGRYGSGDLNTFALQDVTLPVTTIPQVQSGLWDIVHINNPTECDDLWAAYHMWQRLAGIKPTTRWQQRYEKLKDYFIDEYLGVINPDGESIDANHEHLYGWGLCEAVRDGVITGSEATSARTAIDNQVTYLTSWANAWNSSVDPGDEIAWNGPYGRRWARMLRFAVAAYEASPIAANKTWRDRVIDIILQDPDVHFGMNVSFFNRDRTINTHGLDYDAGERTINTFHMGTWMDALWQAWRVLYEESDGRTNVVRLRLIALATLYRDFGPNTGGAHVGKIPLFLNINADTETRLADNAGSISPEYGSPEGVYTIPPTNGLVMAYKLTGIQSFLTAAWANYEKWLELRDGGEVGHYVDSVLDTTRRLLANNKGELQYAYALFENGGNPAVVGLPGWVQGMSNNTTLLMNDGNGFTSGLMRLDDVNPCPADNCSYSRSAGFRGVAGPFWNGAITDGRRIAHYWNGGHNAYGGGDAYELDCLKEASEIGWEQRIPPINQTQLGDMPHITSVGGDVRVNARHSYDHIHWDEVRDLIVSPGAAALGTNPGNNEATTVVYDRNTDTHVQGDDNAIALLPGHAVAIDTQEARLFVRTVQVDDRQLGVASYSSSGITWIQNTVAGAGTYHGAAYAPDRRTVVWIGPESGRIDVSNMDSPYQVDLDVAGVGSLPGLSAASICYCRTTGRFYAWNGGSTVYVIIPPDGATTYADHANGTWSVQTRTMSGSVPTISGTLHSKWRVLEQLCTPDFVIAVASGVGNNPETEYPTAFRIAA